MKRRVHMTVLVGLALTLTLGFGNNASAAVRLEGSLGADDAWIVDQRPTRSVTVGAGSLHFMRGTVRHLRDHGQNGPFVRIEGVGLEPGSRYMVLAGTTPVYSFEAGANGRFSVRMADGIHREGWLPLRPGLKRLVEGAPVRVVSLSGERSAVDLETKPSARLKNDEGYFDWTPLCGVVNDPSIMPFGEAMVMEQRDLSIFSVWAEALTPGGMYTVIANGVEVGTVAADSWGMLWLEATDGEVPGGQFPTLPEELLPVSRIAAVEVLEAGVEVLAGDFTDPCMPDPPQPGETGTIELCDTNPDGSPLGLFGLFDWMMMEDGLQVASLMAFGLEPGMTVDFQIDGVFAGSTTVSEWGELWMAFSTDPVHDELPLPDEALPLNEIVEVAVAGAGAVILSGTAGEPCDFPEPPIPVEMDTTPLCGADGAGSNPGNAWSEAGWAIYDTGMEEFWVFASGLEVDTSYDLTVDGVNLGAFSADDWGGLYLFFSSHADGTGGGWQRALPLPDSIRPVSGIDVVSLGLDGASIQEGSFSDPCDDSPWEPPMPVDSGWTWLCGPDGSFGLGEVSWNVYDTGDEELMVWAFDLEPGLEVEIVVDGNSLGAVEVDPWGSLFLTFATWCDGDTVCLPLPDVARPVSEIDVVELVADGEVLYAGSFADPCEPEEPPMPVEWGFTDLCADQPSAASGEVMWTVFDDGAEELIVSAFGLDASSTMNLVVDGVDLGSFTSDEWGGLFLFFASNPVYGDQLQLPDAIRPVSTVDEVEILDVGGAVVLAGSFSLPCTPPIADFEMGVTGLCDGDGLEQGYVSWWILTVEDTVIEEGIEIMVWEGEKNASYPVEIDAVAVGELQRAPFWAPEVLMLSLGPRGDAPVPSELSPVSGIDSVQVLTEDGEIFLAGSFNQPCSQWDDPGDPERENKRAPLMSLGNMGL